MAQFSVKIINLTGSVLGENQQFETHVAWFSRAVNDPTRLFLIIEQQGIWLGYLRFDPLDARVGIALLADARGKRIGGAALMQGCLKAEHVGFAPLFADIHETNPSSRRVFERCGFESLDSVASSDGFRRFMRHPRSNPPTS
jgi:L-amino acid N-acyltransferase YncA